MPWWTLHICLVSCKTGWGMGTLMSAVYCYRRPFQSRCSNQARKLAIFHIKNFFKIENTENVVYA